MTFHAKLPFVKNFLNGILDPLWCHLYVGLFFVPVATIVLFLVVAIAGAFVQNHLETKMLNAILTEVDRWNWSQPFVQAKFKAAKWGGGDGSSIPEGPSVPARLEFYRRKSPLAKNSATSHI